MAYTGYRVEWLLQRGTDQQRALLAALDLMVDGPYVERFHAPVLWRGSANQRLLILSDRYRDDVRERQDTPAGVVIDIDDSGFTFVGVPPFPRFREVFETSLRTRGLELERPQ